VVTAGKTEPQEDIMSRNLGKEWWHTDRLFGTNSLKEETM
jgi:hypothetical protein